MLAQIPFARSSACSDLREAASGLAIVAPSLRYDLRRALLLSDLAETFNISQHQDRPQAPIP